MRFASTARNTAASATSLGEQMVSRADAAANPSRTAFSVSSFIAPSNQPVSIIPGSTALTRTFGAIMRARAMVRLFSAPLEVM